MSQQEKNVDTKSRTGVLPSISSVLTLPLDFVIGRVRNVREAELLIQVSQTASHFETAVSAYEVLALKVEALQKGWDAVWLANEPFLTPAIPLIGQAMSQQNAARGHLIQRIEELGVALQRQAASLLQFADMHRTYVRELSAEGLGKLAAEKLLLCDIEKELSGRITSICSGGGLGHFCPMSEFVHRLETALLAPPDQGLVNASQTPPQEGKANNIPSGAAQLPGTESTSSDLNRKGGGEGVTEDQGLRHKGIEAAGSTIHKQGLAPGEELGGGAEMGGRSSDLAALRAADNSLGGLEELRTDQDSTVHGNFWELRKEEPVGLVGKTELGKRPREDDFEGGTGKAPRLGKEPVRGTLEGRKWNLLPGENTAVKVGGGLCGRTSFLPNLVASFELEEGLEATTSKESEETGGSERKGGGELEGGGQEEADLPGLDTVPVAKGGGEEKGGGGRRRERSGSGDELSEPLEKAVDWTFVNKESLPKVLSLKKNEVQKSILEFGSNTQTLLSSLQDPSVSPRERQLLTDEKLTPHSSSFTPSPLTSTQSPPSSGRGPGGDHPSSLDGLPGAGRQPFDDQRMSLSKTDDSQVPDGGLQRSPLLSDRALSIPGIGEEMRPSEGLHMGSTQRNNENEGGQTDSRILDGVGQNGERLESPAQVERDFERRPLPPSEKSPSSQTPSRNQSPAERPGSQCGSGSSPQNGGGKSSLFGTPLHRGAFQLRLSSSSSSPSKSPVSEKLNQSGGAPENGAPPFQGVRNGEDGTLAHSQSGGGCTEGGAAAGFEGPPREAGNPKPGCFAKGQGLVPSPVEARAETKLSGAELELRVNQRGAPPVRREMPGTEASHPERFEEHASQDGPPLMPPDRLANKPEGQENSSQPPSEIRSQSLSESKGAGDLGVDEQVPDSEEGGSRSSGRGVHPGPTPPPSSPTGSQEELQVRARGLPMLGESPDEGPHPKAFSQMSAEGGGGDSENDNQSGETELVPETEEMEEETEEQACEPEKGVLPPFGPPNVASPCRASGSPALSGSQPLSQSRVF